VPRERCATYLSSAGENRTPVSGKMYPTCEVDARTNAFPLGRTVPKPRIFHFSLRFVFIPSRLEVTEGGAGSIVAPPLRERTVTVFVRGGLLEDLVVSSLEF